MDGDDDQFTSVTWDSGHNDGLTSSSMPGTSLPRTSHPVTPNTSSAGPSADAILGRDPIHLASSRKGTLSAAADDSRDPRWEGYLLVQVTEPRKEQEGTKEMFVSYGIRAEVSSLPVPHAARSLSYRMLTSFRNSIWLDQSHALSEIKTHNKKTISRLCLPARELGQGLSGLRRSTAAG